MKSFADKVKDARADLDVSQEKLATMVGVSIRSIASYESGKIVPRGNTVRKLARALQVSVEYLLNDETDDQLASLNKERFINNARELYGYTGAREAELLLEQNKALFAGGALTQEAKDAFFNAIMVAYVTCKEEAKKTYGKKDEQSTPEA